MQLGTILTTAAVLLLAAPTAAQEPPDTVYKSRPIPVWLMVEDAEGQPGVHHVAIEVLWDNANSKLPFSADLPEGLLTVLIPTSEDTTAEDLANGDACLFISVEMEHGNGNFYYAERWDTECYSPPVTDLPLVGLVYSETTALMACAPASRDDGDAEQTIRYYGCYWVAPPEG